MNSKQIEELKEDVRELKEDIRSTQQLMVIISIILLVFFLIHLRIVQRDIKNIESEIATMPHWNCHNETYYEMEIIYDATITKIGGRYYPNVLIDNYIKGDYMYGDVEWEWQHNATLNTSRLTCKTMTKQTKEECEIK